MLAVAMYVAKQMVSGLGIAYRVNSMGGAIDCQITNSEKQLYVAMCSCLVQVGIDKVARFCTQRQ